MLYIVATPIGNLEDITFRAVEVLKNVEKVYCEDTRRTRILSARFGVTTPLESFHHYSDGKITQIVKDLQNGADFAYVSDAGTPGIADPGGKLVEAAQQAGVQVVPIPGPSAVTALLSVAGVYANQFRFAGYVPTKKGRQTFVKKLIASDEPVVFFETAPRIQKFFDQVIELGGAELEFVAGRELTKKFEEIKRGYPAELKEDYQDPKGEFVLVSVPR
ncbi:MAG: 16S rRNA (cytidine(1402)-2'-O)-methyltransferase [Patescibacteria group bacterium]